jgi:uncharacterized RDD family membrane protein YckC
VAAPLLVTPEAVVLDLASAGLPSRLVARLLDVMVQAALMLLLAFLIGVTGSGGAPATPLVVIFLFGFTLILVGYPMLLETFWHGRTLGKAAMGLRVVTKEGAPIRFRHAVIRAGADIVDLWGLGILAITPGIIGAVAIFLSKRGQRLGDMAAGTIVLRERSAATVPTSTVFAMPPGLETYADTVDVSRLADTDYQAARSFLLRARSLSPDARAHVAASLAPMIAARLQHRPPTWVTPEQFLAVAVARRQQRGGVTATAMPGPVQWQPSAPPASAVWPGAPATGEARSEPVPAPRAGPVDGGFTAPG